MCLFCTSIQAKQAKTELIGKSGRKDYPRILGKYFIRTKINTRIYTMNYYGWGKTILKSTFYKQVYMQGLIRKMTTEDLKLFRPLVYERVIGEQSTYSRNQWWRLKSNCIIKWESDLKFLPWYKFTSYVAEYVNSTKSGHWTKNESIKE